MKKILFTGIIVSLAVSCSTSTDQVADVHADKKKSDLSEKELVTVIPNRKLLIEIDGMVCEMGCGGAIRKELKASGGVSRCSFDFAGENVTSSASIEFDKDKISADEISALIRKLNDGQFTVGKMSTETVAPELKNANDSGQTESNSKKAAPINVSSNSGIQLPNFIDLLSELIVH